MIVRLACLLTLVASQVAAENVDLAVANYVRSVDAEFRGLRSIEILWENKRTREGKPSGTDRVRSLYANGRQRIEHLMLSVDGQVICKTLKTFDGTTAYSLDCIGRLMTVSKGLTFEPLMEPAQLLPLLPATGLGSRGNLYRAPIPTGPDVLPALHLDTMLAEVGSSPAATVKIFSTMADLVLPPAKGQLKIAMSQPSSLPPSKTGRMFTWSWDAAARRPNGATKRTFSPNKMTTWYRIEFSDQRPLRPAGTVFVPFAAHVDYLEHRTGAVGGTWDISTKSVEIDGVVDDEEFVIEPSLADSIWDADAQVWITNHADR